MTQRIKRKLKTVYDPKMTSTSAKVGRRPAASTATKPRTTKPAATKPVARKPRTTAATKPASKPAGRKPSNAKHPADAAFDKKRRNVLKDRKEGAKVGRLSGKAALTERLTQFKKRVEGFDKTADLHRELLAKRKAVQEANLKIRQAVAAKNLNARLKARRASLLSKKPTLKDGKVVVPAGKKATYTPIKPKLKPMPRIQDGKIVTTAKKKSTVTAQEHKAGTKASKTRAKGGKKQA